MGGGEEGGRGGGGGGGGGRAGGGGGGGGVQPLSYILLKYLWIGDLMRVGGSKPFKPAFQQDGWRSRKCREINANGIQIFQKILVHNNNKKKQCT